MSLDGFESRRLNADSLVIQLLIQSAYLLIYSAAAKRSAFRKQPVVCGQLGARPSYKYEHQFTTICAKQCHNMNSYHRHYMDWKHSLMPLPFDPPANIQSIKVWVSPQNRSVRSGDRNISAHVRS